MDAIPESVLKPCHHCGHSLCFIENPPYVCACDAHLCKRCAGAIHPQWGARGGCTASKERESRVAGNTRINRITTDQVNAAEILIAKLRKTAADLGHALKIQQEGKTGMTKVMQDHDRRMDKVTNSAGIGACASGMEQTQILYTRGCDLPAEKIEWKAEKSPKKQGNQNDEEPQNALTTMSPQTKFPLLCRPDSNPIRSFPGAPEQGNLALASPRETNSVNGPTRNEIASGQKRKRFQHARNQR